MGPGPHITSSPSPALRDGAAWERLSHRVTRGDLRDWARRTDELRHRVTAKLLVPVEWAPLQEVDFDTVPTDGREHPPSLYMEDTGWPHAALDEYIAFWEKGYYRPMVARGSTLLDIQAVFQSAFGAGNRKEAILMQKIVDHKVLLHLLATESSPEYRAPGQFMHEALAYRDRWESKLLRTSPWSPLF